MLIDINIVVLFLIILEVFWNHGRKVWLIRKEVVQGKYLKIIRF